MAEMLKDEVILDDERLKEATGGADEQSGMPCPCCGSRIPVSMADILSKGSIVCPACGLRIDINKRK